MQQQQSEIPVTQNKILSITTTDIPGNKIISVTTSTQQPQQLLPPHALPQMQAQSSQVAYHRLHVKVTQIYTQLLNF